MVPYSLTTKTEQNEHLKTAKKPVPARGRWSSNAKRSCFRTLGHLRLCKSLVALLHSRVTSNTVVCCAPRLARKWNVVYYPSSFAPINYHATLVLIHTVLLLYFAHRFFIRCVTTNPFGNDFGHSYEIRRSHLEFHTDNFDQLLWLQEIILPIITNVAT